MKVAIKEQSASDFSADYLVIVKKKKGGGGGQENVPEMVLSLKEGE